MNYSEEETVYITTVYAGNPTRKTVESLAEELDKSIKSIIGKLSREGVYRRELYKTKTGETPITKVEIVAGIAEALGFSEEEVAGLEKAPKNTLKNLERGLKAGSQRPI